VKRFAATVVAIVVVLSVVLALRREEEPCASGFRREGPRCFSIAPLVISDHDVVAIPEMTVTIGPSDWEAEGRVKPRTAQVDAFYIDRLELTAGQLCKARNKLCNEDAARAAYGVAFDDARAICNERGGRLPTEDEWLAAAGGPKPRRYPWGDTGAVCRRAAWRIENGPCATGATGPDTVGAHPDGATPQGVQDLAGNVAEWVDSSPPSVRGGSWRTSLATELRTWPRTEMPRAGDATTGFRCAYSQVR
jgi:formylglycine-generating enzyme required for sulfatase activity